MTKNAGKIITFSKCATEVLPTLLPSTANTFHIKTWLLAFIATHTCMGKLGKACQHATQPLESP